MWGEMMSWARVSLIFFSYRTQFTRHIRLLELNCSSTEAYE